MKVSSFRGALHFAPKSDPFDGAKIGTFHPRKGRLTRLPCNKCPAAMPIWTGS